MSLLAVIPFILILLSIALVPLSFGEWWDKNLNKGILVVVLALPVIVYLLFYDYHYLLHTAQEYFSFIVLLSSLYVISGGIVLTGDIEATPRVNTCFLAVGALLANLVGTTGASMLLIRPLLKTNSERKHTRHIPVFFIFVVSNIGGCLTPLADPPLFLGYLRGVPFAWTFKLFPIWLIAVGVLLLVFYLFDLYAVTKETKRDIYIDKTHVEPLRIKGTFNLIFLFGVIVSIFLAGVLDQRSINPSPWREVMMIAMAILSFKNTPRSYHIDNRFSFGPIIEVAVLFAGIFITMVPALAWLRSQGASFGINQPWMFFWLSGGLSSFLDNAPTYLTFLNVAQSVTETTITDFTQAPALMVQGGPVLETLLKAISVGSVFMGANSYIGNGPNFMVKSITEESGLKLPSFFGYMGYSLLILCPLYLVITLIFFRG